MQMCIWQTGVVVEIFCGEVRWTGASNPISLLISETLRIPYVKYSTGANKATCTACRALGKPDWTAARRAFLAGRAFGEWYAESKCLFRRVSAISFSSASFLPILFWQDRKEWAAGGASETASTERVSAKREASYPLSPFPPFQSANASLVCVLVIGLDGTSQRSL